MTSKLQETIDESSPLGRKSPYPQGYDRSLLFPIKRGDQRKAMGTNADFYGFDIWNAYELYWLDEKGKPMRACASFVIPANSPFLCESKSVKLYLNSLNHAKFSNAFEVGNLIEEDLSKACQAKVSVVMNPRDLANSSDLQDLSYRLLDDLDVDLSIYQRAPELLSIGKDIVHEKLATHLFKSHCLCTGQPDLGSIFIEYKGPKLDDQGLLAYLVSYRDHAGFSENCIEQIYADINKLGIKELYIFGRFTRRGGIDINPYRASSEIAMSNQRLMYQ